MKTEFPSLKIRKKKAVSRGRVGPLFRPFGRLEKPEFEPRIGTS
jgi:hypothetical protein